MPRGECELCGKPLTGRQRRYCSSDCRKVARYLRTDDGERFGAQCPQELRRFAPPISDVKYNGRTHPIRKREV